jgi:hypothetical protein
LLLLVLVIGHLKLAAAKRPWSAVAESAETPLFCGFLLKASGAVARGPANPHRQDEKNAARLTPGCAGDAGASALAR